MKPTDPKTEAELDAACSLAETLLSRLYRLRAKAAGDSEHPYFDDDGRRFMCGGGEPACSDCNAEESAEWGRYFGVVGVSADEAKRRLAAMDPRPQPHRTREELIRDYDKDDE